MEKRLDTKVTGLGPMASSCKRWTVVPAEEEETKDGDQIQLRA
jgi:hypothetical protein